MPTKPAALTSLSVGAAELELQLRDDPYRSFPQQLPDGRNVIDVMRWQIERAQRQRPASPSEWTEQDAVLEFARARTLERSHLYLDAQLAYERVAAVPSRLEQPAQQAAEVMRRFAEQAAALPVLPPEEVLHEFETRTANWLKLAATETVPRYASLAREEAESWETLRVDTLARTHGSAEAIAACSQLIANNRDSKLYPQHLLRLGDLHAEAARSEALSSRAMRTELAESQYQQHLEAALSAYELASEARSEELRHEAQARLQALLSYHNGVHIGVY